MMLPASGFVGYVLRPGGFAIQARGARLCGEAEFDVRDVVG